MSIENALSELREIDGCTGAFAVGDGKCIGSAVESQIDFDKLAQLSAVIGKMAVLAGKAGYKNADSFVRFAGGSLYSFALGGSAYVALLCNAEADKARVELLSAQAVETLKQLAPGAAPVADPNAEQIQAMNKQAVLNQLGGRLEKVKRQFISHVGPIGDLLFDKHLDAWLDAGPGQWSRAGELRDLLVAELDDKAAIKDIRDAELWS